MAVEAPEKPNLRALYKELDKEIAFQFGYILDVTQAKEEKFSLKKLLRMQPKKSYQDKLEDLSAIDDISLAAFLPARSSDITKEHQLSPSQITDIAYERLSHNVRKVFKVSQFDIDIILTERNTENLQSVADNPEELVETLERTVPPYLVDWRAIEVERPKGKQEVKDLAQALKYIKTI